MKYYPALLDVKAKKCVVIGGGNVGERKIMSLVECGAEVTVISPELTPKLESMLQAGEIQTIRREYRESDLDGAFLAAAATDDEEINQRIHDEASKNNILCNIADKPRYCNFILPSIIRRGDLIIAISTSGRSPAFAKMLRKKMEAQFGPEYAEFLNLMGSIRKRLLFESHEPEAHKPLFNALIEGGLLERIKEGNIESIDRLLQDVLGDGFDYRSLTEDVD